MTETVALVSSHAITQAELAEALLQAGGILTPEAGHFGRLSHERQHIWLYPGTDFPDYLSLLQEEVPEIVAQIHAKLGGEPRAYISLEISRTPGSGLLAVDFACHCAEKWPCVVVGNEVFSFTEMKQLQREGKGFIPYGM